MKSGNEIRRVRKNERGQTLILVALCIVSLLGMAALAIDVVSLYAARSECQRAADAAALAGAEAFVSSGATTNSSQQTLAQTMANRYANATLQQNLVGGAVPSLAGGTLTFGGSTANPTVTATVQQPNLPLFFARIWGLRSTSVSAIATAEAYNESAAGTTGPTINLTSVKPWLIPNCDPGASTRPCANNYYVDPSTGLTTNNGFLGETIHLSRQTSGMTGGNAGNIVDFYGLTMSEPPASSCAAGGGCGSIPTNKPYIDNIACASQVQFQCGQPIGPPTGIPVETMDGTGQPTATGTRCLIHANDDGPGEGQDLLSYGPPLTITGGFNNPDSNLNGKIISTSDSIVTVPLYDGSELCTSVSGTTCNGATPTKVIGFLQLGIQQTENSGYEVDATVLNAVGCSPSAISYFGTPGVSGGGTSAIPVRLIQNP
jgi:Flp pilus assembly protein TadG